MTAGLLRTRTDRRVTRLGHLRGCLPAAAVTAVLGLVVGALVGGAGAGVGVALGVLLAAATFTFGAVCVDLADRLAPVLVLPVGLTAYAVTVVALGTVVVRNEGSDSDLVAGLPWGVAVGTVVWVLVQMWWAWTSPTPYVDDAGDGPKDR